MFQSRRRSQFSLRGLLGTTMLIAFLCLLLRSYLTRLDVLADRYSALLTAGEYERADHLAALAISIYPKDLIALQMASTSRMWRRIAGSRKEVGNQLLRLRTPFHHETGEQKYPKEFLRAWTLLQRQRCRSPTSSTQRNTVPALNHSSGSVGKGTGPQGAAWLLQSR